MYDSYNEGITNFEDLGNPNFCEIYYDLAQQYWFTINDDMGLHIESSIAYAEKPGLPSPRIDIYKKILSHIS